MPKKKEECLFYRKETYQGRLMNEWCGLNNKKCSFKNNESIFGGECRCLKVGLSS
jgi:hypothetical protein